MKAIILGAMFGIIFGAATVYLALRAGLTVSASIPIAVLTIAVFKRFGQSTILENNIVQTIGSAGESVAAGVVFTIPAFLFLTGGEDFFNYFNILTLALVGGIIGVLFMIPLRRSLRVVDFSNDACGNYRGYVRYIGAGAVAAAGLMTLIKTIPTIVSAFKECRSQVGTPWRFGGPYWIDHVRRTVLSSCTRRQATIGDLILNT